MASATSALLVLAPANPATAASTGTLNLSPGHAASAAVGPAFVTGTASISYVIPSSAARPLYVSLQLRSQGDSVGYRTRASVLADGTVLTGFSRVKGGREVLLRSQATSVKVLAGQTLHLEGSVKSGSGVDLAVRAWVGSAAKPGWQQQLTDYAADKITGSGTVRAWAYLSGTAKSGASMAFKDATSASQGGTTVSATGVGGKPSDASTGVPAGTSLSSHYGNITVTADNTVLDRMDIHGFVTVRARNVRITNSIVRGGYASNDTGLITDYGYPGLVVENVDLVAEHPSVWIDGLKGNNFTARRVHVVGNVDSVKIHGDNVTVENSLLENTHYYSSDPNQGGGPTHNDNFQILYGNNINIVGNTIRGATNFAILGAASRGNTPNLVIKGNWVDGGHCTIKLQELNGWSLRATATDNKFGPHRVMSNCPFQATTGVDLTASGNVYELTGLPVPVLRLNS